MLSKVEGGRHAVDLLVALYYIAEDFFDISLRVLVGPSYSIHDVI
jgi:hypothetical protein